MTVLVPSTASRAIAMSAVICVGLTTLSDVTTMPVPRFNVVPGEKKFDPMIVAEYRLPRVPEEGAKEVIVGGWLTTLKTNGSEALPPPGAAFVTVMLLAPTTALGDIDILATMLVMLFTVTVFTVTPTPNVTEEAPAKKFVPTRVTFRVCPFAPSYGAAPVRVGTGFMTVKAFAKLETPPPGARLVTFTVLNPANAPEEILMLAVIRPPVESIAVELTVTPGPKSTLLTLPRKSEPRSSTLRFWPSCPDTGDNETKRGAGFWTLKAAANAEVPPPGETLVTVTSLDPRTASFATLTTAESCVVLVTAVEPTDRPLPKLTLVTPEMNSDPMTATVTVFPRAATVGLILDVTGAGFITENPPGRVTTPLEPPEFETETFLGPVAAEYAIEARALI